MFGQLRQVNQVAERNYRRTKKISILTDFSRLIYSQLTLYTSFFFLCIPHKVKYIYHLKKFNLKKKKKKKRYFRIPYLGLEKGPVQSSSPSNSRLGKRVFIATTPPSLRRKAGAKWFPKIIYELHFQNLQYFKYILLSDFSFKLNKNLPFKE